MPRETKAESFEKLFARLEERVAKLEEGGLSLEQAIAVYEEGMALARACQERLDAAEQTITRLRESFGPTLARANGGRVPEDDGASDADPFDDDQDGP
jgi:exodeoxyribonuclease VII small subunit